MFKSGEFLRYSDTFSSALHNLSCFSLVPVSPVPLKGLYTALEIFFGCTENEKIVPYIMETSMLVPHKKGTVPLTLS